MRLGVLIAGIVCLPLCGGVRAQTRPTESGPVQGVTVDGVAEFLGIPYAAPPVGALRWQPPAAPVAWTGTRDATAYGPACEESLAPYAVSEDCLTLNIFTPRDAVMKDVRPVMIWIHGGSFISGSGRDFDPSAMVKNRDVIVITINYRLGYFGFLAHPALSEANANKVSGNYGLLDQQAAMAWARRNIAGFGGDPNRITIFGQEAGGQSVVDQLISPGAGPLYAAIIQSGSYLTNLPTLSQGERKGERAAAALGCSDQTAACLYALSAATLAGALDPLTDQDSVSPIVDGVTLTQPPAQAIYQGNFQRIPVINGSNLDEDRLFVGLEQWLTKSPGISAAQYKAQVNARFGANAAEVLNAYPLSSYAGPDYAYAAVITDYAYACNAHLLTTQMARYTDVYAYELRDPDAPVAGAPVLTGFSYGSPDSADLSYLFPSYNNAAFHPDGPPKLSATQHRLGLWMQQYWINLARDRQPAGSGTPEWPAFTTAFRVIRTLVPPVGLTTQNFIDKHHCLFWRSMLLDQAGLPAGAAY